MPTGKGPRDKETWWWSNYVQEKIKIKRNAKKRYDETGTEEDKERNRLAKKEAKVPVAQSTQQTLDNVCEDLDTKEGQRKIYKIAKGRNKATKDITHIKQIKNEDGVVMCRSSDIKGRWKQYFERLLNEENLRSINADGNPNLEMIRGIVTDVHEEICCLKPVYEYTKGEYILKAFTRFLAITTDGAPVMEEPMAKGTVTVVFCNHKSKNFCGHTMYRSYAPAVSYLDH
ncbi:uncharacterized protein [Palaemon carinicauda]|uniref:uncharacterized protein n=1 Tax=Palaemon carinicauda TaxID=392227 RepID=UPI0035B68266